MKYFKNKLSSYFLTAMHDILLFRQASLKGNISQIIKNQPMSHTEKSENYIIILILQNIVVIYITHEWAKSPGFIFKRLHNLNRT